VNLPCWFYFLGWRWQLRFLVIPTRTVKWHHGSDSCLTELMALWISSAQCTLLWSEIYMWLGNANLVMKTKCLCAYLVYAINTLAVGVRNICTLESHIWRGSSPSLAIRILMFIFLVFHQHCKSRSGALQNVLRQYHKA